MEFYSALNRMEILTHATTWRKLEDSIVTEISLLQKRNIKWFYIYGVPTVIEFTEIKIRMVVARV